MQFKRFQMRYLTSFFILVNLFSLGCLSESDQKTNLYNDLVLGRNYFDSGHLVSETQTLPGYLEKITFQIEGGAPDVEIYYRTGNLAELDVNNHLNTSWSTAAQLQINALDIQGNAFIQFAVKENDFTHLKKLSWMFESAFSHFFKSSWVAREEWHARLPKKDISTWGQEWNSFAIHHTAGQAASSLKAVQNVQNYHMDANKWSDAGYHFLLGNDGKIYEGRSLLFQGADVKGHNAYTVGIVALGCFDEKECDGTKNPLVTKMTKPLLHAFGDLIGLLAHKKNLTEITVSNVKGHLQFSGAKTVCPGNIIMNYLDDIIAIAKETLKQLKLMAA